MTTFNDGFEPNREYTCDKCGREIELDEDAILRYHIGVPRLLCPECAEKKDEEDFDD